jgi:hypothetical protein
VHPPTVDALPPSSRLRKAHKLTEPVHREQLGLAALPALPGDDNDARGLRMLPAIETNATIPATVSAATSTSARTRRSPATDLQLRLSPADDVFPVVSRAACRTEPQSIESTTREDRAITNARLEVRIIMTPARVTTTPASSAVRDLATQRKMTPNTQPLARTTRLSIQSAGTD